MNQLFITLKNGRTIYKEVALSTFKTLRSLYIPLKPGASAAQISQSVFNIAALIDLKNKALNPEFKIPESSKKILFAARLIEEDGNIDNNTRDIAVYSIDHKGHILNPFIGDYTDFNKDNN